MAYPPATLSTSQTNATPQQDTHPADHQNANRAINDIVAELGNNPSGTFPTLGARLDDGPYGTLAAEAYVFTPEHAGIQTVEVTVNGTNIPFSVPGPAARIIMFTSRIQWRKALGDTAGDVIHNMTVKNASAVSVGGGGCRITMHDGGYTSTVVTRQLSLPPGNYTVSSSAYTTAGYVNAQERSAAVYDMGA